MMNSSMCSLSGICVGVFAGIGAATVGMLMTRRGRNILTNVCNCASGCMHTAGMAAEDIASEMRDCFTSCECKSNEGSESSCGTDNTSSDKCGNC